MNNDSLPRRIWKFFCSLKLAIVLASSATFLIMGGSLVMHYNPRVFGNMDSMALGRWLHTAGAGHLELTWWLALAGIFILLLAINTICCFLDWLSSFRARWRKSGEYLIHLGFVLIVIAYFWGSLTGFRSPDNPVLVGEQLEIAGMPGYSLYLEDFEADLAPSGRPIDMRSTVELRRNGKPLIRQVIHTNTPLLHEGLVVVPGSFGRVVEGFHFFIPGRGNVLLKPGETIHFGGGKVLRVINFFPHADRTRSGDVRYRGDQLGNPAFELELLRPDSDPWRGWYFLREKAPFALLKAGLRIWPTEPAYRSYSILTVNRDPGARLALVGAIAMVVGVLFAMISFYYKRARGDRPDVV